MFRSATTRIALVAVAITMAISILFSWAIYHSADSQLQQSARRQYLRLRREYSLPQPAPSLDIYGHEQDVAAHNLILNLIYLNLVILALSTIIGYYWARRTLDPIEKAMELQGQFAADASHELRTPLAAMRSEIEVALRSKRISEGEARQLLSSNLEEIAKLEGLAGGLLQLARLEQNFGDLGPVAVAGIITSAIKSVSAPAKAAGVTIKHDEPKFNVLGKRDSLVQVITILLDNAIKYGRHGGTVEITSKTSAHKGIVVVKDDGPGISADDLPHVFERFWRASSSRAKDHNEGYGLGLAIANEIVTLHKGDIRVDSSGGQGTRFTIELPLA